MLTMTRLLSGIPVSETRISLPETMGVAMPTTAELGSIAGDVPRLVEG
jgi:hypothetical protein